MKEEKSSDFIKFGSYSAMEADILKPEFEKIGIPVKVLYPGTSIGRESTAGASWTAYTIMIPSKDVERALEVRKRLNIKTAHKIPLPKLLYTNINRYIFGMIFFPFFAFIILGYLGLIDKVNKLILNIIFISIILGWILFFVITGYKIFKKRDN